MESKIAEKVQTPSVNPWLVTIPLVTAAFLFALNETIANVALPYIAGTISISRNESTWIVTSYLVASSVIIPAIGYFCKVFGRKKYFIFSIILFTVASMLCGLSRSMPMIIVSRFLQGIGGGAILPLVQAIMMEIFPQKEWGKAMSLYGFAFVIAPIIGPVIGVGGLLFGLLNMQISLANVFLPNFLYGTGMVMSMTPVINLSCATLRKEDLTMGSSLQNLMKNLGASFGTSIATTCLSRFSQMHQNMMVGYLNDLNPVFAQRVHEATMHMAQYVDIDTANYMALKQMHFTLLEQSTLWAFIDTFRIFALASFVIIPLLLLMKEKFDTK